MKCKIINGKKICKKSSNPFKIWGSWIGGVVGFIVQLIYSYYPTSNVEGANFLCYNIIQPSTCSLKEYFVNVFSYPIIILGFLLGYVLTILYRRVFK